MDGWDAYKQDAPRPPALGEGERFHVFLSHRSTDKPAVTEVYDILTEAGFRSFFDAVHLAPGDALVHELEQALEQSRVGLLFWSKETEASTWVGLEYSVFIGLVTANPGFTLIPISLDDEPLPAFANTKLWVDLSSDADDRAFQMLRIMYAIADVAMPDELSLRKWRQQLDRPPAAGGRAGTDAPKGLRVDEAPTAGSTRRPLADARVLPRNDAAIHGRDVSMGQLKRLFGRRPPTVSVLAGPSGIGKQALAAEWVDQLRRDEASADLFPDGIGVHPRVAASASADDMLNAVWREFYEVPGGGRLTPEAQDRDLRRIKAHIVVPNHNADTATADAVTERLADSSVMVTTTGEAPASLRPIQLPPLDAASLAQVFADHALVPALPTSALPHMDQLSAKLAGRPGLVRLLGSRAFTEVPDPTGDDDDQHPLTRWLADKSEMDTVAIIESLMSPAEEPVVAAAQAVGVPIPREILGKVAGSEAAIDEALVDKLLVQGSPRYTVRPAVAEELAPRGDEAVILGQVLDHAVPWVEEATVDQIFDNRDFVMRMLRWAMEDERWSEAIRLARAAEPALARSGRWGAWKEILEHCREASRSVEPPDRVSEAWAVHQLGARALVSGDMAEARPHLFEAEAIWEDLGDHEGVELARHNLGLVPLALSSLVAIVVALTAAAGLGFAFWFDEPVKERAVLDIEPELIVAPSQEIVEVTVFHRAGVPVQLTGPTEWNGMTISGCDGVFPPVDTPDDEVWSCVLTVDPSGHQPTSRRAELRLEFDGEVDIVGDDRIVVARAAS